MGRQLSKSLRRQTTDYIAPKWWPHYKFKPAENPIFKVNQKKTAFKCVCVNIGQWILKFWWVSCGAPINIKTSNCINLVNKSTKCIQFDMKKQNANNRCIVADSIKSNCSGVSFSFAILPSCCLCLVDFERTLKQPFFSVLTRWFYCTNSPIANKHIELKEMVFVLAFFSLAFHFQSLAALSHCLSTSVNG